MTPKTEVKVGADAKNAEIEKWMEGANTVVNAHFDANGVPGVNGATGAMGASSATGAISTNDAANIPSNGAAPPIFVLNPSKEREEMQREIQLEVQKAVAANEKAAQQKYQWMQQEFDRQMRIQITDAEQKMQIVQNQARKEIEDADRQREQVAAAIIESEMKKVREKESKVDQQLKNIAERYEARQSQEQADRAELVLLRERAEQQKQQAEQQQQRAEQQIMDLKKELKRQKEKVKEAANRNRSEQQHPFHQALQDRQMGEQTHPKSPVEPMQISPGRESLGKEDSRLQDTIDQNTASSHASSGKRDCQSKKMALIQTPLEYGKLSNESFFAMKQLAVNKAKDARPEVPFSSGTSIEYALHMNAFDSATDSDALDAKDKLFELTKWFAGPASKIVNAYNVREDKAEAYASVRSELDVFFSQHRDSFSETLKEVKKGGQIDENDYDTHFELYSDLKEAQMMLVASRQVQEFDRRDVLRDILESRLKHMENSFWLKDEEKMRTTGSPMKFDDLLIHIQRWMTVLNNKGKVHKRPTSKTNATSSQLSSVPAKLTYANRLINSQPK